MNKITLLLLLVVILGIVNCKKDTTPALTLANVTTDIATSVNDTSAVLGGNVTKYGGSTVIHRGLAISLAHNPTISDGVVDFGSGTGAFSSGVQGFMTMIPIFGIHGPISFTVHINPKSHG